MQVTEVLNQSLSRGYDVRVPAAELGAMLDARIAEISPTLRLKGFRPGKVPPGHVRRMYGKALMGEVIEKTISETSRKVLDDNGLRIAAEPDLKPSSDMEAVLAGKEDLTYALEVEVMPEFEPTDVGELELTRLTYATTEAEIDEALAEVAKQNRSYAIKSGKQVKAADGDQLVIDFVGRIGGEAFDGGTAEDVEIVLGAGQFIPGFEEQLVGVKPGAKPTVNITFPDDYQAEKLRGQAAEFEVEVKEVRAPKDVKVDDDLAVSLGLSDLAALREAVRSNLDAEFTGASRFKLKRALLDALDARHDIPLPARMVEGEFTAIWAQVEADEKEGGRAPEDLGKSEEILRAEYRRIAERRVRLGLVLAEIGRRANVSVSDAEITEAMRAEARRFGESAQRMFDYMRENPEMQARIRAPIYEEKVVDLIIAQAKVTDRAVSKETLLAEDELPAGIAETAPAKKPAKTKRASSKAEPESPEAGVAEAKPKMPKTKPAAPKLEAAPAKGMTAKETTAKAKAGASGAQSDASKSKAVRKPKAIKSDR